MTEILERKLIEVEVIVALKPEFAFLEDHLKEMFETVQIRSGRSAEFNIESVNIKEVS